jgi:uncharacterized protein (DUF1501 family)
MTDSTNSRREFLRKAGAVSATVGTAGLPFAMNLAAMNAAVAQASDYKAIVCLFMYGGNDSANMVLPTDTASWTEYAKARVVDPDPIALKPVGTPPDTTAPGSSPAALGGVLPIVPTFSAFPVNSPRTYALHPTMTEMQSLFNQSRVAVIANAGPLVQPLTKAEYSSGSKPKPSKLFSHNDQQSSWQALAPEGAKVGWGGRFGDLLSAGNSQAVFTSISLSGNAVFMAGNTVFQYQVGTGGAVAINGISTSGSSRLFNSTKAALAYRALITQSEMPANHPHVLARAEANMTKRSIDAQANFQIAYNASVVAAPGTYFNPTSRLANPNPLATQLQSVARIINTRSSLGVTRQVFFVSIGGCDTHDNQNRGQAEILARVSHAINYFDGVLGTMGLRDKVTLFTASDFGRTLSSNGDGTDHGWGAHHFVYGGAVNGKQIYGRFPQIGVSHSDEVGSGVFLPGVSVDQIGGTLGKWFGVSSTNLDLVFPNLNNFQRDLGFMV